MTNLELQEGIVQNLLLGLKKQSEAYLDLISNTEYTHDQRKDFEKELSDINKVLNELSGKTISYTVAELEALKNQFNDRLTQLNTIITNLEINTLKIEFDSLTSEQKAFLKGEKGDKGDKGENSYELAVRYGFVGNEIDYLNSLKGKDGKDGKDGVNGVNGINGVNGENGLSVYELAVNNGFTGTLNEWLLSLKGATFEDLTQEQKDTLKGQDGLSAYELALNNGFTGTLNQWLESLKGSGNGSITYPIPYDKIGTQTTTLNDELARISQGLGDVKGQIGSVDLNDLNSDLQSVKGSISSFSSQFESVWALINGGEVYNAVLDEIIQFEGLINMVNSLSSRIDNLESSSGNPSGGAV